MKIIKPSVEFLTEINKEQIYKQIELAGRTCYKSEDKTTEDSCINFVKTLVRRKHFAMLEFGDITVKFICDRGILAEITRHRLFSFAVESTRYNNYNNDKFNNELTFIEPCFWKKTGQDNYNYLYWLRSMQDAENTYLQMIQNKATPQEARSILPNSLKTEIVVKGNLREWIHFINLRSIGTTGAPHPQMKEVADMVFEEFKNKMPEIFEGMNINNE